MGLVGVHSPETESEVAIIVAMLEAHDVPCFVHNHNLGSLLPGVQINALNTQTIMVPEECVSDAVELLRDYRAAAGPPVPGPLKWKDKLRVICEGLLMGWFVPGHSERKDRDK
jgi:hypothetical protein